IDAVEKQQRKLCYKVIDLAKPLLFQFRSKLRPGKARAVRTALKLWTVLFRDILQDRRRNILKQTYPDYANLLDDAKAGPGGEELFGRKFLKRLKSEAKAQNTLDAIRRKAPAANRRGTDQSRAGIFKIMNQNHKKNNQQTPQPKPNVKPPTNNQTETLPIIKTCSGCQKVGHTLENCFAINKYCNL
ncbi:MAG TPA: hypothetical protein VIO82_02070, partial [Candidatus Methylopumilus sp.]